MKAILEFNLPEDNQEFKLATKASDWWCVCWEMNQWLRAHYKCMPDKICLDAMEKLSELMNKNGVSLDDVQ
jgi:hypothetical protein